MTEKKLNFDILFDFSSQATVAKLQEIFFIFGPTSDTGRKSPSDGLFGFGGAKKIKIWIGFFNIFSLESLKLVDHVLVRLFERERIFLLFKKQDFSYFKYCLIHFSAA